MSHFLNSKDLGSITAYGDAVTGGYDGTRESFYGLLAGIASGAMLIDVGSRDVVLSASNWNNGEYDLSSVLPTDRYNVFSIGIDGDIATGLQIAAWYNGEIVMESGNKLLCHGDTPEIDIPVGIVYQSTIAERAVPVQSGTVTYNGESQSPTWDNYDPLAMTISGDATGTNAGEYVAIFTLTQGYRWSDGTNQSKSVSWTIDKAQGYINLSKSYFYIEESTDTITITGASGNVSVSSDDTSIATVSISNDVITATYVSTGETSVSVTISETNNYYAYSGSIGVYSNFIPIYGASYTQSSSSSAMTRTDSAVGMANPVPSINGSDGSSPFDNIMPWSGMHIVNDPEAGTLVEIPKYYYKWSKSGNTLKLQISPIPMNGYFTSPAHADRGDGKGERDVVYVGRFPCNNDGKSSVSGTFTQDTLSNMRTKITALGDDIWQYDLAMRWTIKMLIIVEYPNWYFPAVIGTNSTTHTVGQTDDMPYHTGTTGSTISSGGAVQYRHIELPLGSEWIDGAIKASSDKIFVAKNPADFANTIDAEKWTSIGSSSSNGYAMNFNVQTTAGFEYALLPSGYASSSYYTRQYNAFRNGSFFFANYFSLDNLYSNGASSTTAYARLMKLP